MTAITNHTDTDRKDVTKASSGRANEPQILPDPDSDILYHPDPGARGNSVLGSAIAGLWLVLVALFAIPFSLSSYDALSTLADGGTADLSIWGLSIAGVSRSLLVLYTAGAAGMLGSLVIAARYYAKYFSKREFSAVWVPWYILRILIGGIMGALTVLALAIGLLSGGGISAVEPGGVVVIGFIMGLTSKRAIDKFRQLVDIILGKPAATALTADSDDVNASHVE